MKAGGMLYEDNERNAQGTIANHIKNEFHGGAPILSEEQAKIAGIAQTSTMLDYSRPSFNKAMRLSARKSWNFTSKYPMKKLGKCAPFVEERIQYEQIAESDYITTDNMLKDRAGIREFSGVANISTVIRYKKNDILISNIRPYLKKIWQADRDGGCSPDVLVFRITDENELLPKYLYYILQQDIFFEYMMGDKKGTKMPRGDKATIPQFPVPVPPIAVQQQIIEECAKIDEEYNTTRMSIDDYGKKIKDLFDKLEIVNGGYRLTEFAILNVSKSEITDLPDDMLVSFIEMASVSNDGYVETMEDRPLADVRKGSYTYFRNDDIIIAKITPCMENGKCAYVTGLTNGIGFGSSEFHTIRCDQTKVLPEFAFHFLNRKKIREEAAKVMTGASGHRRVPETYYSNIRFPEMSIDEQNEILDAVHQMETKIIEAKKRLSSLEAKREEILTSYLQ